MAMAYHKSIRVGENFYCYLWLGKGNDCNTSLLCHVLRGERSHVLIDPGHIRNEFAEPCFDSLVQTMEKDGFRLEDVGLIIGTHCHPDHFEAGELVAERSGALIALSREEDEFYEKAGKMLFQSFGAKVSSINPSFYLKEGDLYLGAKNGLAIKVLLTPGHSPGSICLYLAEEKILVSGDVVFFGSIGRTDFPGGSPSLLRSSIDRLSQLDVESLVPGHSTEMGSIIVGKDKVRRNFHMVRMII